MIDRLIDRGPLVVVPIILLVVGLLSIPLFFVLDRVPQGLTEDQMAWQATKLCAGHVREVRPDGGSSIYAVCMDGRVVHVER